MAALVQSYPQQSSTVTMLQTRPSSASGILQTGPQTQSHHPYPANQQMQRNSFHGMNNGMGVSNYRGQTTVAPIAPYAFTSTPNLTLPSQRTQGPQLRPDQRTSSAPIVPTFESGNGANRSRYPPKPSVSTTSSSSSSDLSSLSHKSGSRDDSAIMGNARVVSGTARPNSTIITSSATLSPPTLSSPVKPSPDRYRRPNNRRAESSAEQQSPPQQTSASNASIPNVMQFYGNNAQQSTPTQSSQNLNFQVPQFSRSSAGHAQALGVAADDMLLNRQVASQDPAKRYRRRSIHTIDAGDYGGSMSPGLLQQGSRQVSSANGRIDQHPLRSSPVVGIRPVSSHDRNGSSESVNSTRSGSGHHSRPSSVRFSILLYTAFLHACMLALTHRCKLSLTTLTHFGVHFANPLNDIGHEARGKPIHSTKPRLNSIINLTSLKRLRRADFNQTRCSETCKYSSARFVYRCREANCQPVSFVEADDNESRVLGVQGLVRIYRKCCLATAIKTNLCAGR